MIQVKNVVKTFKNVKALKGVDLHVPKGSIKALLGPNGAGKTTLVRIIATLLSPTSGSVTIDGSDALKNKKQLRTKIGLSGQYAAIDEELTGYENLLMFSRLYHLSKKDAIKRTDDLLAQFSLTDAAHRQAKNYSGGMRRRLDLGASLIVNPPILFLDEPTSGLDPASRKDLWKVIEELKAKGTTVLLTTQYLEEADYLADSITVINEGKIIAEGTADELKTKSGGNVLEVVIKEKNNTAEAIKILEATSSKPISFDKDRLSFSVPVDGKADVLIDVVRQMDQAGINILDIQLRRPTLDDVFISLTGKATE